MWTWEGGSGGGLKGLHNEELQNLYTSPSVIRMVKARSIGWVGHVARMGEITNTVFWLENLKGRDHSEDLDIDGRIILERILGKYGGDVWTGFIWFRIRTNGKLLRTR